MEFLALGLSLAQPRLLQPTGKWTSGQKIFSLSICLSLSHTLPFKKSILKKKKKQKTLWNIHLSFRYNKRAYKRKRLLNAKTENPQNNYIETSCSFLCGFKCVFRASQEKRKHQHKWSCSSSFSTRDSYLCPEDGPWGMTRMSVLAGVLWLSKVKVNVMAQAHTAMVSIWWHFSEKSEVAVVLDSF